MSYQNILSTSEKKLRSVAFGSEQAERPHSVQREVRDLREDVERAFEALESGTNAPEIHRDTLVADASDNDCEGSIKGINLLAGRGVASVAIGELTFFGLQGEAGNKVSITINTGTGALGVAVSGTDITVTLANGGSTSSQIKGAIDGDANAKVLVAVDASGSSNVTAAVAKTSLTGGSGDGISLFVYRDNGTVVDLSSSIKSISDTKIALNSNSPLTGNSGNDVIAFVLKSHTVRCAPIQVTVAA